MSASAYIIATIVVVIVFIFILKKVFSELDRAGDFVPKPEQKLILESDNNKELDDLASTEFVRRLIMLYQEFNSPNEEILLQLQALLNANAAQIKSMLAKLLPQAEESIAKAQGDEKAREFYERAGQIYDTLRQS